jgi:hypothetical protein
MDSSAPSIWSKADVKPSTPLHGVGLGVADAVNIAGVFVGIGVRVGVKVVVGMADVVNVDGVWVGVKAVVGVTV